MTPPPDETKLRRLLETLVDDYWAQPGHLRAQDLREINRLRRQLGERPLDAQLREVPDPDAPPAPEAEAAPPPDPHVEARAVWARYVAHEARLAPYRAYCKTLIKATDPKNGGTTPIWPLRFMGTDGDEVVCDECHEGVVLEGQPAHGKTVKEGWPSLPNRTQSARSYILGGVIFMEESNGTFRCYHGYLDRPGTCYAKAERARTQAERAFREARSENLSEVRRKLIALLEAEGSSREDAEARANAALDALYDFDPGLGANRPG